MNGVTDKAHMLIEFEKKHNRRLVSAQPYEAMHPIHFGHTDIEAVNAWAYRCLWYLMQFNKPEKVEFT
jgi:hypothetical protein